MKLAEPYRQKANENIGKAIAAAVMWPWFFTWVMTAEQCKWFLDAYNTHNSGTTEERQTNVVSIFRGRS